MRPLLAVALLAALAPAAPVPKALKKADSELLVGRWVPTGTSRSFFEFHADGTMRCWTEGNEKNAPAYTWVTNSEATPKRMTWSMNGKPKWEAVYELDGDSLKFLYAHHPAKLPSAVKPDPEGNFEQLTRDTSAK